MPNRDKRVASSSAKHAVIIINPVSGQGDPTERRKMLLSLAHSHGWKGKVEETTQTRGAGAIASDAIQQGIKELIVCGGDGTIMEVLEVGAIQHVVISVIPLGTGNLFAQNLGIPLDSKEAMKVAFTGVTRHIDVGNANGHFFSIIAGMGMDAEVMRDANRELKDRFGLFAYVWSVFNRLSTKPGTYEVILDKKKPQRFRAKSILVANLGKITGGIQAVPKADPESGTLQVAVINAQVWYAWISLIFNALRGTIHKSPHYTLLQGKTITIRTLTGPKRFQCDGDAFPPTDLLRIQITPAALAVRVP